MVDSDVNIRQNLPGTEGVRVCRRPPSGSAKTRTNFKSVYGKDLSKTTQSRAALFVETRTAVKPRVGVLGFGDGLTPLKSETDKSGKQAIAISSNEPKPRRVQSAHARLSRTQQNCSDLHDTVGITHELRKVCRRRPVSANASSDYANKNAAEIIDSTAHGIELMPSVYGYKSRITICDNYANLPTSGTSANKSLDVPYKFHMENQIDAESFGSLVDFHENDDERDSRCMPGTLEPLLPWSTPNVPGIWTGVEAVQCLIFLPSLVLQGDTDLPVVPAPHDPLQELPCREKIVLPKPKEIKKYEHPWKKQPLEQWVCRHSKHQLEGSPSSLKIYSSSGNLLHESQTCHRTVSVVRKEIQELEELMRGIGNQTSCSIVVQYQAEINQVQSMLNGMSGRLQEIDQREAEKQAELQQAETDYCGLRAFYKDHEKVMAQIRRQHVSCVQELARLESELGLSTDRAHFKKQHRDLNHFQMT